MPFQPGQSGNPRGRPKGTNSGRTQALQVLDSLLAEDGTQQTLEAALRKALERDPYRFFVHIIMPLLPKHAAIQVTDDSPVRWVSFMDSPPGAGEDVQRA